MSDYINEKMVEELFIWCSDKLGRPVLEKDVDRDKGGFFIRAREKQYIPNNLQDICLMLKK